MTTRFRFLIGVLAVLITAPAFAQDVSFGQGGPDSANFLAPADSLPADFYYTTVSGICRSGNRVSVEAYAYQNLPTGYALTGNTTHDPEELIRIGPDHYNGLWDRYTTNLSGNQYVSLVRIYQGADQNGTLQHISRYILDCTGKQVGEAADVNLQHSSNNLPNQLDGVVIRTLKSFSDNNPMPVDVTISCNTGLPIEVTKTIQPGGNNWVEFIVKDFADGTLNCSITEEVPDGYTAAYLDFDLDPDSCEYSGIYMGQTYLCSIFNDLDPVAIDVTKIWYDDNSDFNNPTSIRVELDCEYAPYDWMRISGNPGEGTFWVYPHWDGEECDVDEDSDRAGVIVDDSDCQNLMIAPGVGAECTIENTRLYEGIPTLSQYGLGILALLMLAIGAVGFRRFA